MSTKDHLFKRWTSSREKVSLQTQTGTVVKIESSDEEERERERLNERAGDDRVTQFATQLQYLQS